MKLSLFSALFEAANDDDIDSVISQISDTADIEPPNAPRKEFDFRGHRFMVIEMMWNWELRWQDPTNGEWRVIHDIEPLEKMLPGLEAAYSKFSDIAEREHESGGGN